MHKVNIPRPIGRIITPLQARRRSIVHGRLNRQRVVRADLVVAVEHRVVRGDDGGLRAFARAAGRRDARAVLCEVQVGQAFGHGLVGGGEGDEAILEAVAPVVFGGVC